MRPSSASLCEASLAGSNERPKDVHIDGPNENLNAQRKFLRGGSSALHAHVPVCPSDRPLSGVPGLAVGQTSTRHPMRKAARGALAPWSPERRFSAVVAGMSKDHSHRRPAAPSIFIIEFYSLFSIIFYHAPYYEYTRKGAA